MYIYSFLLQDTFGNTPVHMSVWYELIPMFDLLVSYDENGIKQLANAQGLTPLKLAAARGSKVERYSTHK